MTAWHKISRTTYLQACETPSDINLHLPVLKAHADLCDHITEFGVRDGQSSRAFLHSAASHIRMYDLHLNDQVQLMVQTHQMLGRDVTYMAADTRTITIEPTQMLFVDTLHTFDQLQTELKLHAPQVHKFMAFHDTQTFGTCDEPGYSGPGLLPALLQFLKDNPLWFVCYHDHTNNGLTILQKNSKT